MNHKKTDVTLLAAPFGFGPLGKALAIAHEFESRGLTVKILGDKTAQQISKASHIYAEGYEYRAPLDLATLNTHIALSCLDVSTPINKSDIPLILVDSLFWLRGTWERAPSYNADLILAQRFFLDAPESVKKLVGDRLRIVDAILPTSTTNLKTDVGGDLIILYPGGMRSPYLDIEYQEKYLCWAIDIVGEATRRTDINMSNFLTIVPPQLQHSQATKNLAEVGGRILSSVDDLGRVIQDARCLVVAPGIEIMLEACATGRTPYYLPAFNGSHIPQLMAYRKEGTGIEICPSYADRLRKFEAKTDSLSMLSKEIEKQNIEALLQSPNYRNEGITTLVSALKNPKPALKQYPLGRHGAAQVVDISLTFIR